MVLIATVVASGYTTGLILYIITRITVVVTVFFSMRDRNDSYKQDKISCSISGIE